MVNLGLLEERRMAEEARRNAAASGAYEWVRSLVCVVVPLLLVFTFLARIVMVDGSSMRETLQDRDILLVLNGPLCGEYAPGEIVVLQKADFNDGRPIVKRVIAVAGQTVDIDFAAGVVYVDGAELAEPYILERTHLAEGVSFPLTVPEGCLFVLGDNRNHSDDSRNPALGVVDGRRVIGRALGVLFPGRTAGLDRREWGRIGILN